MKPPTTQFPRTPSVPPVRAFLRRHWLACLVLIFGALQLPASGPTFSANDRQTTLPGWVVGGILIVFALGSLLRAWRRERSRP
jgi:hypothetical protein